MATTLLAVQLALGATPTAAAAQRDQWDFSTSVDPFTDATSSRLVFVADAGGRPLALALSCSEGSLTGLVVFGGYMAGSGGGVEVSVRIGSNEAIMVDAALVPPEQTSAILVGDAAETILQQGREASDEDRLALRVVDPHDGETVQFVRTMRGAWTSFPKMRCAGG